ncbi:hypothetical protein RBE51_19505 [Pseudomonas taiwanensis]|uniref:hypothetical protein n=1 Tax=Pseudomonas taiwanensis TaxID=470150 RepID=UPI0028DEBEB2|nr:hypothetical protein [Pseudomonas taiwanensis]MDT8924978.1 hypothetical protein [Pseudomonas taiwanensis]
MSEPQSLPKWEVPKSYDIGVAYYFRNLLKGNPYQERFFKQWIARIDESNIKNYYDYETDKPLRSTRGEQPLEIAVDQIERMVQSANLPRKIETQLFDQIDYLSDNKGKIDFKRVKELFAYAGIEGVYDLENKRHFQVEYDPPFTVDNLFIDRWSDQDRVDMARMMAEKGEIPDHRQKIAGLQTVIAELNMQALSDSGIHAKLQEASAQFIAPAPGSSIEELERSSREVANAGNSIEALSAQAAEENERFEQREDILQMRAQIEALQQDEAIKLAKAVEKVPASLAEFPVLDPKFDMEWDESFERSIDDVDRWAKAYFDGKGPADFPNHEPDAEEAATLDRNCMEAKRYDLARYNKAFKEFEAGPLRQIRIRNAGFKDWALKDFVLSSVNRGEIAKNRILDVPRDFANAVKAEMADGLMAKIKAPTRIEKIHDDSGRYTLVLNNLDVGSFHPDEVLSMSTDINEAPQDPKAIEEAKRRAEEKDNDPALQDADSDAYIPGEPDPQTRRTAAAGAAAAGARLIDPGQHIPAPKGAAAPRPQDPTKPKDAFPGMGMSGMGGMGGMPRGMGGMGMPPPPPPMFNISFGLPKTPSFKGLSSRPGVFSRNAFDPGVTANSINAKMNHINGLSSMLETGAHADGKPLSADQTLRGWSELTNSMKSLQEDVTKAQKYGAKKGSPALAESVGAADQSLRKVRSVVDEKAKEPGAVGECAKQAKEHMDKVIAMIQSIVKMMMAMFSKGRSNERSREREESPEPT